MDHGLHFRDDAAGIHENRSKPFIPKQNGWGGYLCGCKRRNCDFRPRSCIRTRWGWPCGMFWEFVRCQNGFTIVKRRIAINIFNTTVTSAKGDGISLGFMKLGNTRVDINIESVSIARMNSGHGRGTSGIVFFGGLSVYDAVKVEGSMRIHNVTITGLSDRCVSALCVFSFRNLTVSDTTIKSNPCNAIQLFQSTALFQRNVLLTNNTAEDGGGIYMALNSLIVLDLSTRLQLHNNTAEYNGGGIYVYI